MKDIKELSLKEKIGQMFMIGMLRESVNEQLDDLIMNEKIGGVIVYKRNYKDYKGMVNLINDIKKINHKNSIPLFISIDQEGGRVNRMPNDIKNVPAAWKLVKTKNMDMVKTSGKLIGEMLRKTGISMNYAPTLDIKRFPDNHAIGDRCFGENCNDVSKYGIEVMKQLQQERIISVIKHFPGHGATKKDSHFSIPKVREKREYLEKNDIKVFENAINNGADAIMVGHLIVKDLDRRYPASLSKKIINDYLIDKYHFNGLIITDDLKMEAIQFRYSMKKAALKAIEAGNDIIMVGLPYKKIKKILKYITKKVEQGKISEERINKSVEKILMMKEKYEVNDNPVEGFVDYKMNDQILKLRGRVDKDEIKKIIKK